MTLRLPSLWSASTGENGTPDPILFARQDPTRIGTPHFAPTDTQNGYTLLSHFWDGHQAKKFENEKRTDHWYNSAFTARPFGFYGQRPVQYDEDMLRAYNRTLHDIVGYQTNVSSSGQSFGGANADRVNDYHRFNFTGANETPGNIASGDGGANRIPKRADPAFEDYEPRHETARTKSWSMQHGLMYLGQIMGKFRTSKPVIENADPDEMYARFLARSKVASLASAHNVFEYQDPYALQFVQYQEPVYDM